MSAGAEKDYRFPQKANWRCAVWNEIRRRVPDRKMAHIAYLAGEENLDAAIMQRKGFRTERAIAIERDARVFRSLRANGTSAVKSSLYDAVRAWPDSSPVSVLYADTCQNLSLNSSLLFKEILLGPAFSGSVVMINMLRGREAGEMRDNIQWLYTLPNWKQHAQNAGVDEKHRGFIGWVRMAAYIERAGAPHGWSKDIMQPKFFTYRSGTLLMDSVVWTNPLFPVSEIQKVRALQKKARVSGNSPEYYR